MLAIAGRSRSSNFRPYLSCTAKTMQTRSKESAPRSSTKRVSGPISASGGAWMLLRTTSASSASAIGSVIGPSPEHQGVVRTTESERGAEDDLERGRPRLVGHIVEIELRVGQVVDRRRDDLTPQ